MAATTFRATSAAPTSAAPRSIETTVGFPAVVSRLAAKADSHDRRRWMRSPVVPGEPTSAGPVAGAWATAKLGVMGVALPIAAAVVAARAASNTAATKRMIVSYPGEIEKVMRGEPTAVPNGRVGRLESGRRLFISSDLHRCVRGASDWPSVQNTKGIYETALEYYGAEEWGLVENGDVEDFWLVGGSTYGVVYDLFRMLAPLLPGEAGERLRIHLCAEHLSRIIDNNRGIYDRIDDLFHRHGRYHRLVGNHDDCYLDERVVDHLRAYHEGVDMFDFLVLDHADQPVAVLAHGHHTDSWNAPFRAGLGRMSTSMASAVVDAPFLSANPGTPDLSESTRLLAGTHTDVLTVLNPMLGFNRELYTIDEVLLFQAFEQHFGDDPPLLLLGHTHLPVSRPSAPRAEDGRWTNYLNSGDGVHHELITGLEWDGVSDPEHPSVRLVAWHYADEHTPDAAIMAEHEGRPVARRWFRPTDDGRKLDVFPANR